MATKDLADGGADDERGNGAKRVFHRPADDPEGDGGGRHQKDKLVEYMRLYERFGVAQVPGLKFENWLD